MGNASLYERDFYAWTREQSVLLRSGRLPEADIEHVAEEIESMGRAEKRELVSRLKILLLHLLKWQFQPGLRGNSRRNSIRVRRIALDGHLRDDPGLKAALTDAVADAYRTARIEAETETGLAETTFPEACPWPPGRLMAADFWPDDSSE